MTNPEIDEHGTQRWYNADGECHRIDLPAIIYKNGTQVWTVIGKFHRTDGPAWIGADGTQEWWVNGMLHRIDGPAYIGSDGRQWWYVNDKRMRNNKDFQEAANLTDEEMTATILKYGNVK